MKKWKIWLSGIFVILMIVIIVIAARKWTTYTILKTSRELSGDQVPIPESVSSEPEPIVKGDADWISWQGENGDNRSLVSGIIKDWSGGLRKVWQVDYLCQGNTSAAWSAPVIQGNRLIVCGRNDESDLIFCLDPRDGRLLWHSSYKSKAVSSHGAGPRATSFIDNDRVYTFGRSGDLACWNLSDGDEIWRRNITDEGGKEPTWGHSSSPLILNDLVIVQAGGAAGTIAYDKHSGTVAWKSGQNIAGYAAITGWPKPEFPAVLSFHGKGLAAIDARNGEVLWNVPWETQYDAHATTPVVTGDFVFITSGYKTGCQLLKADGSGAEILWRNNTIESMHSDPYVIDGFLYGYSGQSYQNRGVFKCVTLQDGVEKWSTGEMGWGTCVFVDDHLLCCDIKGNIFLMKPHPDKFILATKLNKALGDVRGPVWTKPVVANGFLYLRFKQRLICYALAAGD
ncbi:PQQ-like beta-propeller repeat protein [candidate division KSB1 bacterium]|nr:PQQ-like beta-propeller repeat protein [candidate division KSB1 bacterium]